MLLFVPGASDLPLVQIRDADGPNVHPQNFLSEITTHTPFERPRRFRAQMKNPWDTVHCHSCRCIYDHWHENYLGRLFSELS